MGAHATNTGDEVFARPSISVKLSALHPRYEFAQRERVLAELLDTVAALARRARDAGIGLTIDAEEADRLELSLELFARLRRDRGARRLRRARPRGAGVPEARARRRRVGRRPLARDTGARIPVRLVKGAYWDTEIKRAQVQGLANYPVFTRKAHTDVSYLACARALLDGGAARLSDVRHAQRAHDRVGESRRRMRRASTSARSSSSGCTAWARRCTTR